LARKDFREAAKFLLQVDITEIVLHKADEPDAIVNFFDADCLTGQAGA
jgi:hypothetical protein